MSKNRNQEQQKNRGERRDMGSQHSQPLQNERTSLDNQQLTTQTSAENSGSQRRGNKNERNQTSSGQSNP